MRRVTKAPRKSLEGHSEQTGMQGFNAHKLQRASPKAQGARQALQHPIRPCWRSGTSRKRVRRYRCTAKKKQVLRLQQFLTTLRFAVQPIPETFSKHISTFSRFCTPTSKCFPKSRAKLQSRLKIKSEPFQDAPGRPKKLHDHEKTSCVSTTIRTHPNSMPASFSAMR